MSLLATCFDFFFFKIDLIWFLLENLVHRIQQICMWLFCILKWNFGFFWWFQSLQRFDPVFGFMCRFFMPFRFVLTGLGSFIRLAVNLSRYKSNLIRTTCLFAFSKVCTERIDRTSVQLLFLFTKSQSFRWQTHALRVLKRNWITFALGLHCGCLRPVAQLMNLYNAHEGNEFNHEPARKLR